MANVAPAFLYCNINLLTVSTCAEKFSNPRLRDDGMTVTGQLNLVEAIFLTIDGTDVVLAV
jgi:hypothetical protein